MGKKRSEWKTRERKRSEKQDNPLKCLVKVQRHFFADLQKWIDEIEDPRNEAYITYTQADLIAIGCMKNLCSVESMRNMSENFNEETCIRNLSIISGDPALREIPHYDTLNYYLEKLSPQALTDLRTKMVRSLIRSRDFDGSRLLGRYWRVILDGTGLFYFKEKHCENCLKTVIKNEDGSKFVRYYHKVLEAKLVLADNIVISLDTEFIENENENVTKQDCEINAAKRLLGRLKDNFPRMKICIQGDALYAAETIMGICARNDWKYLLTHKPNRQPTIDEFYNDLEDTDKTKVVGIGKERGTGFFYNHLERIAGKTQVMDLFEYQYEAEDEDGNTVQHRMMWITNINLTKTNLNSMVNAGRGRWKIENEGFNTQKNILYRIQHLNSRNGNAMKNHYLLTQISDIIMQLYLAWDNAHSTIKKGLRNMADWLRESFRKQALTDNDLQWIEKRTSLYLQK